MPPQKKRSRTLNDSGIGDSSSRIETPSVSPVPKQKSSAGQILCVELKNFMIHASLELALEPNKVNFITGRNGAGKSSILQAVVLALGGNAKATKRGAGNVKQFVRYGCNKAEIRVHLSNMVANQEDLVYKGEVYGNAIVMERVIYISPQGQVQSKHLVRNAGGQVVYEGKKALEEKKHISQRFSIQMDNPTAILQQEEAKVFFTANSPTQWYDFFFRASMLKAARDDYSKARQNHNESKELLAEKNELKKPREEEEEKMERINDLMLKLSMQDSSNIVTARKHIIKARDAEAAAKKLSERILEQEAKVEEAERQYEVKEDELKELQRKYDAEKMEKSRVEEHLEELTSKAEGASKDHGKAIQELKTIEHKVQNVNNDTARLREQINKLKNEMFAEKKKAGRRAQDTEEKNLKLQNRLADLNSDQSNWRNKIEEGGNRRKELQDQKKDLQSQRRKVVDDKNRKKAERDGLEKTLRQLQKQQEQSQGLSRIFGIEMENLASVVLEFLPVAPAQVYGLKNLRSCSSSPLILISTNILIR